MTRDHGAAVTDHGFRGRRQRRREAGVLAAVAAAGVLAIATILVWPSGHTDPTASAGRDATGTQDGTTGRAPSATATTTTAAGRATSAPPPTASPTRRSVPATGGKPGPSNTGVPAGTRLTVVNGNQIYSTPNKVISGMDIHGFVEIRASSVTIKNSIIRGGPNPRCNSAVVWIRADAGASATIQDSEIAPTYPSPCLDGIWATNATLLRMDIRGAVDGVKAYDNVTLQDSYVHDLSWFASDPNQGGGATHNDAVQTYEGNRHIVLRHNTMNPGPKGNAAYQVTQDSGKIATDLRIDGNWLDGGGCTLNFAHKGGPTPMTGIYVTNNRFGRGSTFQCPILVSTQTTLSQNSGNVWDDTGRPIPAPQRHD